MSGRLVAAMTMTPPLTSNPSSSTSSWFSVCSRSSWPPPKPGAAVPAHGVDLVHEHDRGRVRLGLLEQVAHPGGADTDEHLHEVRTGDRVERDARLTGDRAAGKDPAVIAVAVAAALLQKLTAGLESTVTA